MMVFAILILTVCLHNNIDDIRKKTTLKEKLTVEGNSLKEGKFLLNQEWIHHGGMNFLRNNYKL